MSFNSNTLLNGTCNNTDKQLKWYFFIDKQKKFLRNFLPLSNKQTIPGANILHVWSVKWLKLVDKCWRFHPVSKWIIIYFTTRMDNLSLGIEILLHGAMITFITEQLIRKTKKKKLKDKQNKYLWLF